jgi:predicted DNA-binding WGR domain protein
MNQCERFDSKNELDAVAMRRETRIMRDMVVDPIHLRRVDAARNMRRFYELGIQPTLFGGFSLVRAWGRIGSAGQCMVETFDREAEATEVLTRLMRAKRRRGYREPIFAGD